MGMYVQGFEGSWFRHPFWRTRFLLIDADDLARIRAADVDAVVIDDSKGESVEEPMQGHARPQSFAPRQERQSEQALPDWMAQQRQCAFAEEKARATRIMTRSKQVMKYVFDEARLGKAVRTADVQDIVHEISASVWRNSQALIRVTRLKSKDEYTYLHSVAVCALMVNLARHLKLDEPTVQQLGLAGLLHDIGKIAIPERIINKPGSLSDDEFAIVRDHPKRGSALLAEGEDVPDEALDVCRHHHEKIDGSGYPYGLSGDAISLAARMGAICDVYDALTSNRAYKDAWSPVEAITNMARWDGHFDEGILFAFMQSISVFPVGMLVRLRSNRLAVVLDNGKRASRPMVKAFYSAVDREPIAPEIVTIHDSWAHDQIVSREDPADWGFADWESTVAGLIGDGPKQVA